MKNVFDRLSPTLQLILAQCSAMGFDLAALLALGADGISQRFNQISTEFKAAGLDLKAILGGDFASLKKGGDITAAVEEATKALQEQLTAEQGKVGTLSSQLSAFNSAVTAFGATPKAGDAAKGLTAADIEAALNARASIKAADQLAKHGIKEALPLAPAADATKPAKPASNLTGYARVVAAFEADAAK